MAKATRDQFLDTAETLFAERGFYGVSIAAIATELGLTKQALLHHFGSKEKLYGEVLKRISGRFEAFPSTQMPPKEALKSYLLILYREARNRPDQTRLLMRELLDHKQRAETAGTWYLKPFLERLIQLVQSLPGKQGLTDADALATAYQLLGAINYFGISQPTLTGIFGAAGFAELDAVYEKHLSKLIDAALA